MMLINNIDRSNDLRESKAPFTTDSDLDALGTPIPGRSVLGVSLYVRESNVLPVSLTRAEVSQDYRRASIQFTDANSNPVGTVDMPMEYPKGLAMASLPILDSYGSVCGSISFIREFLAAIVSSCLTEKSLSVTLDPGKLSLIPQCVRMDLRQGVRQFQIGGNTTSCDVTIVPDGSVRLKKEGSGYTLVRMDRFAQEVSYDAEANSILVGKEGLHALSVRDYDAEAEYDARDKSLIVKSGVKSNVRVINTESGLSLTGVLDA